MGEENVKDRLITFIDYKGLSKNKFEQMCGLSTRYVSNIRVSIQPDTVKKISLIFPDLNMGWLLTGEGDMLLSDERPTKKQIPLYDVQTIGGKDSIVANMDPAHITDMIDAGDWFPQATAAMHHYGDSMLEYPSGCILVLRRVNDRNLLINGRNYVIETDEYRVTKMIRDEGDYLMAYSTNEERLADGSLKHAPFKIFKESIRSIDLVIGCVIKDFANKPILIK